MRRSRCPRRTSRRRRSQWQPPQPPRRSRTVGPFIAASVALQKRQAHAITPARRRNTDLGHASGLAGRGQRPVAVDDQRPPHDVVHAAQADDTIKLHANNPTGRVCVQPSTIPQVAHLHTHQRSLGDHRQRGRGDHAPGAWRTSWTELPGRQLSQSPMKWPPTAIPLVLSMLPHVCTWNPWLMLGARPVTLYVTHTPAQDAHTRPPQSAGEGGTAHSHTQGNSDLLVEFGSCVNVTRPVRLAIGLTAVGSSRHVACVTAGRSTARRTAHTREPHCRHLACTTAAHR